MDLPGFNSMRSMLEWVPKIGQNKYFDWNLIIIIDI